MLTRVFFMLAIIAMGVACPAAAQVQRDQETDFRITVLTPGGGFIGNDTGGARVIVRDRRSGDVLAEGVTHGASGDPAAIQTRAAQPDAVLADDNTADLEFSLELVEPVPVTITATGPSVQPQAAVSASRDMILVPGKDYSQGHGILMILPGLAVDILSPPAGLRAAVDPDKPLMVTANAITLSGHQIAAGSLWPPERYQVEAHVYKEGAYVTTTPLKYGDQPGLFQQALKLPQKGSYQVFVTVYDPATKEAGMDSTSFIIE